MRIEKTSLRTIALALITISLIATATIAEDRPLVREAKVIVQFNSRPDFAELYVDGDFVGTAGRVSSTFEALFTSLPANQRLLDGCEISRQQLHRRSAERGIRLLAA